MTETQLRDVVVGAIDRAVASVLAKRARTAVPTPTGAIIDTHGHAEHLIKAHEANPASVGAGLVHEARQRHEAVAAFTDVRRVKLLAPGAGPVGTGNVPTTEERVAAAGNPAWSERLHERDAADAVKRAPRIRV